MGLRNLRGLQYLKSYNAFQCHGGLYHFTYRYELLKPSLKKNSVHLWSNVPLSKQREHNAIVDHDLLALLNGGAKQTEQYLRNVLFFC